MARSMKHKYYIERKGGSKSLYPLYRSEDLTKLNRAFFDAVNKGVLAPVSFQITMSYKTRKKTFPKKVWYNSNCSVCLKD